jgi:hypothetical protein
MELADYIKTMKRGEKVPALFIVVLDSELAADADKTSKTKRIEGGALLKAQNCDDNRGMQELRAQLETRVTGEKFPFFGSFEVKERIAMADLGAHARGSLQLDAIIDIIAFGRIYWLWYIYIYRSIDPSIYLSIYLRIGERLMDQLCNLAIDVPLENRMSEAELRDKFSSGNNVFRLEGYFDWLRGTGGKTDLKDASKQLYRLKDRLKDLVGDLRGTAQEEWYKKDQLCGRMAGDQLGDDTTEGCRTYLRNRYHAKFEKR